MSPIVDVVGGGLAGCEAAVFLARRGVQVRLWEMRPGRPTPAHTTPLLGELVCTNSFKSEDPANAHGQLKREMALMGSILLEVARHSRVPAGTALAVDRALFAQGMTRAVEAHPGIRVLRRECLQLPEGPAVVATGPLTSDQLAQAIQELLGGPSLSFYDAIAPIVSGDSVDRRVAFPGGRFQEDDDYLNCPLDRSQYEAFVAALREADVHHGHEFDLVPYFEGCLPIEVLAARGDDTLRFGPMKPVGLEDPRSGRRPWAVVQLRREDRAGQMWNLVGFQTRLKVGDQRRVFRSIPGLEQAEFFRWGSIHRNTFLNFPRFLTPWGSPWGRKDLVFAGQITGVEGYTESAASGLLAALNLWRILEGKVPSLPPPTTILGGLYRYLAGAEPRHFQPMNSHWGLVDPLPTPPRDKEAKRAALALRAMEDFRRWWQEVAPENFPSGTRAERCTP